MKKQATGSGKAFFSKLGTSCNIQVNYDIPELPAYTVYIFHDEIASAPQSEPQYANRIKFIAPGNHRETELESGEFKLLYFLPGTHSLENDKLNLKSNRDIFLARGAVLKAGIAADRVENVRIFGHGIIDGTANIRQVGENWKSLGEEGCLFFLHGQNIIIDGPVLYNPQFWAVVIAGTTGMAIRNFKVLAWIVNDDGIQPRSVNDFTVEHCFIKTTDDCVAIKTRRATGMTSRRLRFRNLVLWQDVAAHGLEIGHTSQADLLEDIRFENIEFIHGGRNALSMHVMDHETVRNVVYNQIYFEGKPFKFSISFEILGDPSPYKTDDDCGQIMDVTIENLHFEDQPYPIKICGYNENHTIRNISFMAINYGLGGKKCLTVDHMEQLDLTAHFAEDIKLVTQ